ncbi:MAG: magnesium chelatase [Candidatus Zixiibacteriota bacterium]|nr:MAG: magnesium chelatase [candidate division Zixibacteria bacterium]
MKLAKTLGELKETMGSVLSTKNEMRKNLLAQIRDGKTRFPGIIGYERTVLPQLENAILSRHDIILLGLRGQAKTRICRQLVNFLDEYIPIIRGSELNENPFSPISARYRRLAQEAGDELEIAWLHRDERYHEKLATPDVSVADLIGDIDPIKAVREKLDLSDEEVLHWGIIPRTNRGLFAINELPDLQPRIQVVLLNILEENDMQIRGFPVRIPLDMMLVFTANPEDYTNRGNIITPLKDRIASQINTHYPGSLEDGKKITQQEAWIDRKIKTTIPELVKDVVEQIAIEARQSEYVDQSSGVSARLAISAYENLISNIERRAALNREDDFFPRMCDLYSVISSVVGKVELVYEGELEGPTILAVNLIGEAMKRTFERHFPQPRKEPTTAEEMPRSENIYEAVTDFFSAGRRVEISDEMPYAEYKKRLDEIAGLKVLAKKLYNTTDERETYLVMEFILEGLHRMNILAKESPDNKFVYSDMIENILRN